VVHLIRYSLAHASWKERKELAGALRPIYRAATLEAAESALDAFEAGPWGGKFPAIVRSWRRNWEQVIPFFAFSAPIRRVIYTTNAIESLNSTVRRAVRTRGHFPTDRAAMKLIYLRLREIERKWGRPQTFWSQARAEFAIRFGERFPMEVP
jgi:putative transposase